MTRFAITFQLWHKIYASGERMLQIKGRWKYEMRSHHVYRNVVSWLSFPPISNSKLRYETDFSLSVVFLHLKFFFCIKYSIKTKHLLYSGVWDQNQRIWWIDVPSFYYERSAINSALNDRRNRSGSSWAKFVLVTIICWKRLGNYYVKFLLEL